MAIYCVYAEDPYFTRPTTKLHFPCDKSLTKLWTLQYFKRCCVRLHSPMPVSPIVPSPPHSTNKLSQWIATTWEERLAPSLPSRIPWMNEWHGASSYVRLLAARRPRHRLCTLYYGYAMLPHNNASHQPNRFAKIFHGWFHRFSFASICLRAHHRHRLAFSFHFI